jgi:hypothetical protein
LFVTLNNKAQLNTPPPWEVPGSDAIQPIHAIAGTSDSPHRAALTRHIQRLRQAQDRLGIDFHAYNRGEL